MSFIYIDNIAGTKPDVRVVEKMLPFISEEYGNPSAHFYPLGRRSYVAVEEARKQVAALVNANADDTIVFTSNGTESNNLAVKGILAVLKDKKHMIVSEIEHASIHNLLAKKVSEGYTYTVLKVDTDGKINLEDLKSAIRSDTALVAISHANPEIGVIQDIESIGKICEEKGIYLHVDAIASAGVLDIDVNKIKASTLTIASQNIYGPRGAAALYIRNGVKLKSLLDGGHQEGGYRSGSENVAAIVGFGEACKIAKEEMKIYVPNMQELRDKLIAGLRESFDFLHFTGSLEDRLPYHVSFWVEYIEGESLLMSYTQNGIYAASGSACSSNILAEDEEDLIASHVLTAVGVPTDICAGSMTMTLSKYNTQADIDHILEVTPKIVNRLCEMSPAYNK